MESIEEEFRREPAPVRFWYVVVTGLIAIFVVMGVGYGYIRHVQNQADEAKRSADAAAKRQQLAGLKVTCSVIDTMETYYKGLGTAPAAGVAGAWEKLRVTIGCDLIK